MTNKAVRLYENEDGSSPFSVAYTQDEATGYFVPLMKRTGTNKIITIVPVISTTAYAAGDNIGGKLTFANATRFGEGFGSSMTYQLSDKHKQNANIDLVLFTEDPTASTFTDNVAQAIADADLAKICGVVKLESFDYASFADNSVIHKFLPVVDFVTPEGVSTIYGALVIRDVKTYASTGDLTLRVSFDQE